MVAMGLRLVSPLFVRSYIHCSFIILGLILNVQLKRANQMQSNDDIEQQQQQWRRLLLLPQSLLMAVVKSGRETGMAHLSPCTAGTDKTKDTKCRPANE